MRVSYNKLWKLLVDLKMSKADLRKATGLASGTMTKLRRDEEVSLDALMRICKVCKCNIGDVCDFIEVDTREE
jgi:DNA-binding Xre family transcriptional regulator